MSKKLIAMLLMGIGLTLIPLAQAQQGATDPNVLVYTLFHDDFVEGVAWAPDGSRIMTRDLATIYVWDAATGEQTQVITPENSIINARWSDDSSLVLALTGGNNLTAWDATSGAVYFRNENAVEFDWSQDSSRAMTVNYETVQVWDTRSGQMLMEVPGVGIFSLSPDGRYLLAWSAELTIWQVDNPAADPITVPAGAGIGFVQWSNDSQQVAAVFFDGTIQVLDPTTGQPIQQFSVDLEAGSIPGQVKWNRDDTYLLAQVGPDAFYVWNATTGDTAMSINTGGVISSLRWNQDGTRVVAAIDQENDRISVWTVPEGNLIFDTLVSPMLAQVSWSADDRFVAMRERESGLIVRTADGMALVFGIMIPEPPVPVWHPTEPRFLTVWGNTVNLWNLERSALFPKPSSGPDVYELMLYHRCWGCHFSDNEDAGPSLANSILGQERRSNDGRVIIADEAYIRESIVDPNTFIVEGYYAGSHSTYFGVRLSEAELDAIVQYIMSLPQ